MANVEFGTGKSVLILTIVAACFAILWPKIFYPMLAGTPVPKRPVDVSGGNLRQERPPHLRPETMHPALKERGRAIPTSHIVPKVTVEKESAIKPPLPGMRPPMGGAGHVVPPPKTGGTMSIVMPLYTIGIVIFFMYTIMKIFVRKNSGDDGLKDFQPDPEFRRVVFAEEVREPSKLSKEPLLPPPLLKAPSTDTTRLGWKERDTRDEEIDQLRRRLEETERAMERIVAQMGRVPTVAAVAAAALKQEVEETKPGVESTTVLEREPAMEPAEQVLVENVENVQGKEIEAAEKVKEAKEVKAMEKVKEAKKVEVMEEGREGPRVCVMGVETRARAEGGGEWRPPPSPTLGLSHSRPATPLSPLPPDPEPHHIFLEGSFPSRTQLLVEDAATELLDATDPAVILSGKMTLSLISVDASGPLRTHPVPNLDIDTDSTLLDIETAVIDDASIDGEAEGEVDQIEEGTQYTTANTAANPSAANAVNSASGRNDAEADDTAADLSAQDFLDDQEDLQEEYDAIWGAMEMEDDGASSDKPQEQGQQHQR